jgi:DNA-binding transcriptional LysR family regulator
MEWNQLRYFYEVAKRGSFTRASQSLRISQPSLSKMVKQLETHEGYAFLERGKKGVRLTPMGEILFRGCEDIFDRLENLKKDLNKRKDECIGELWVGASDNLCNYLLPEWVLAFQKTHSKVQIRLYAGVASEIQARLKDYQVEIGFFYTPTKEKEFLVQEMAFIDFVAVVNPKLLKETSPSQAFSSLGYIGSQSTDYKEPYPTLKMLRKSGIEPRISMETNNQETQKRLALKGGGYTVLPIHMVHKELESGALVRIKTSKKLGSPLYFVKRRNRPLSKQAELWVEHFRKGLRELGRT